MNKKLKKIIIIIIFVWMGQLVCGWAWVKILTVYMNVNCIVVGMTKFFTVNFCLLYIYHCVNILPC